MDSSKKTSPIEIVLPGEPFVWKRPGQRQSGRIVWRYDQQKKSKAFVRWQMHQALMHVNESPLEISKSQGLAIEMKFFLGVAHGWTEKLKNVRLWGLESAFEKPDYDNLEKFYLDCAKGLLWIDDKRIVDAVSKKKYSRNPRVIIKIMAKENLKVPKSVEKVLELIGPDKFKSIAHHVQELAFLTDERVDENMGESEAMGKAEWLAWSSLLLVRFAKEHVDDFREISKINGLEKDVEEFLYLKEDA